MSFAHLKNCPFLLDLQEFIILDRVFLSQLYLLQISSTHLWLVFYLFKWYLFINRFLILLLSNLSISFFMVDAFCVLRKFPTSRSWRYSLMVFSTISIVLPFICRYNSLGIYFCKWCKVAVVLAPCHSRNQPTDWWLCSASPLRGHEFHTHIWGLLVDSLSWCLGLFVNPWTDTTLSWLINLQ